MTDAFIYDHVRSPRGRGKIGGALNPITPINLVTQVLQGLRDRNELDTALVDDVILGCVTPVGEQGANIARVGAIAAGYAETVPGKQINRFCASGLEAVNSAASQIMAGQSDVAVGGGVECMSRIPMGSDGGAMAIDPQTAYDTYFVPQGIGADLIATLHGFSREDVDAYALVSQQRAAHAWEQGYFSGSVMPVRNHVGEVVLDHDETIRADASMESLGGLNPAFAVLGDQ
ncbi:MAG: beta-ketoacyl synthase N-terminal-like domain-containing protein, partial [Lysobacterales bacterium]